MQLVWIKFRSFNNSPDAVTRLQTQFNKLLFTSSAHEDPRKRAIRAYTVAANVVRWGQDFLEFGIRPSELRHIPKFYDNTFKPLSAEPSFVDFLQNHLHMIDIESYADETLNNIQTWAVAIDGLKTCTMELCAIYKF